MQLFKPAILKLRAFRLAAGMVIVIAGGIIGMISVYDSVSADAGADAGADSGADLDAALRVPDGYRAHYQYLGTWAVASDEAPGSQELHVVYAQPGTIEAYRAEGSFPDGTILVRRSIARPPRT
jgi:hypothetical protein